jgi:hypothetical protein
MFYDNDIAVTELKKYHERMVHLVKKFGDNLEEITSADSSDGRREAALELASTLESMHVNVAWTIDELFRVNQ